MNDYLKYRGKCKEFSEIAVLNDPTLRLEQGHYICPFWGSQPHWWTVRQDGTIFDPTKDQFPSKGAGEYVPFDGTLPCAECGKTITEDDAIVNGNYGFCSTRCACRFVGV